MNKFKLVLLSILGGINVVMTIFTPIILAVIWVSITGLNNWTEYLFYGVGLLATLFRAIKIGLKDDRSDGE